MCSGNIWILNLGITWGIIGDLWEEEEEANVVEGMLRREEFCGKFNW